MNTPSRLHRLMAAASLAVLPGLLLTPANTYGLGIGAEAAATADSARGGTAAAPVFALSGSAPSQASVIATSQSSSSSVSTISSGSDAGAPPPQSSRSHRRSSSSTTSSSSTYSSGKDVVLGKNPVIEAPAPGPEVAFTLGWDSQYMFKGLDNVRSTNYINDSHSIAYAKLTLAHQGFGFNLGYLQSVEKITPIRASLGDIARGKDEFYSEVIAGVNYTAAIVGGVLDATVGYNGYYFPEEDFWGVEYQGELWARVALVNIPFVTPNVVYSYFHADKAILEGHFLEFRLDSSIPVYEGGNIKVAIKPYALASYDIDYNASGDGWAALEVGVRVPISIGENFILALSGNYGWDLGDDRSDFDRGYDDFWGGVSVTYRF